MLGIWTLGRNIFVYPLWSSHQCDQIGRFLKILGLKICYKSSPKDCQLFGLFCKTSLLCKNCLGYFLGILGNIRATFYSNIWSHCFPSISISNWSWQSIICLSTFFSKKHFSRLELSFRYTLNDFLFLLDRYNKTFWNKLTWSVLTPPNGEAIKQIIE